MTVNDPVFLKIQHIQSVPQYILTSEGEKPKNYKSKSRILICIQLSLIHLLPLAQIYKLCLHKQMEIKLKSRRKSIRERIHISLPLASVRLSKDVPLYITVKYRHTRIIIFAKSGQRNPESCACIILIGDYYKHHISFGFHLSNEGRAKSNNFRCQTENVNLGFRTVDTIRN